MTKFLAISILALFLISFISAIVIAPETPTTPTTTTDTTSVPDPANAPANQKAAADASETLIDKGVKWWNSSGPIGFSDNSKAAISKLLLMFLVVMLIYSIISIMPFFPEGVGKEWIPWAVSIVVGILSFIFVSATDIKYILATYQGLGIILTSLIPLLIIIGFTVKFRESQWIGKSAFSTAMSGIIVKIIISIFMFYIVIKYIIITSTTAWAQVKQSDLFWFYPAALIIAGIWLFAERKVFELVHKEEQKVIADKATETQLNAALEARLSDIKLRQLAGEVLSAKDKALLKQYGRYLIT